MEQKEKFYKKLWFMWLLIILIPPVGIIFMWISKKEMKIGKKILITIVGLVWFVIWMALGQSGSDTENNNVDKQNTAQSTEADTTEADTTESNTTEEITTEEAKLESFETELTAGHYEVGVDIPQGTYNITCISGQGNVSSSNMFSGGLNEVMNVDTSDGFSIDTFNNAKFSNGDELTVSSTAVIKITSEAADASSLGSRSPLGVEIELSSGNFVAGTDFEPGVYDITCITGQGNVYSDNILEGGLNEVMNVDTSNGFSISLFKNAKFESGTQLTISGCTIKLTPSK